MIVQIAVLFTINWQAAYSHVKKTKGMLAKTKDLGPVAPSSIKDNLGLSLCIASLTEISLHHCQFRGVGRNFHWRGPSHGERGARAYNGDLGAEPPAGSRAEPLLGGQESGGKAPPLKLKAFQTLDVEKRQQICSVLAFWELELA